MSLSLGPTADVCFRMAELLYQINDLPAARERYSMAVEFEAGFVEARANLGCVLVELGQVDLAMAAFAGALEHHPEYPDVHFHLARLLDDQNQPAKAWKHWAKFLELTPDGPWAEEARQRIDSIPE
jgi:tetratricopeptide (TPR) repeat protein